MNMEKEAGEKDAVDDFSNKKHITIQSVKYSNQPSLILKK